MVVFMARSSSKHTAKVAAGGQRTLGNVQAKPAVYVPSFRPLAKRQAANTGSYATCLPIDLRRAGIVAGTQDGDFGFGANFLDDTPSDAMSAYTWTPSGRR